MQNTERDLKLYYSISEATQMSDVNESLLHFWEKGSPQIAPKKGSRGVRQYRKEDVETIHLIYHLVKEQGMTLPGTRQKLRDSGEAMIRNFGVINRLKQIREELLGIRDALDKFSTANEEER